MADKKQKYPKFVSFKGTFKFPKLTEPDYGTDEYPKPDGEYSTQLVGDPKSPEVKAFLAKLTPLHEEAVKNAKEEFKKLKPETKAKLSKKNGKAGIQINDLYSEVFDKDTEEKTGEIQFKFALKASGERKKGTKAGKKWTRKVAIFDAVSTTPLKNPPEIWGGTVGKVSFEARPYFIAGTGAAGLKLELQAVRVLELVGPGERDASAYGFGDEEEGGFAHDDTAKPKDEDEEVAEKEEAAEGKGGDEDDATDF